MGEKFAAWVREREDLWQIVTPPAFALTVITIALPGQLKCTLPDGMTEPRVTEGAANSNTLPSTSEENRDRTNALTKNIYESINAGGEIFLTSSVVKGIYSIRVVSANEKADEGHLRSAFEILVNTAEMVLSKSKADI